MVNNEKYKYDFSELKGRIISKVGSYQEFARKIGRTPQFVSKVFNGKTYFTDKDIVNSIPVLGITLEEVGSLFFTVEVNKCEPN